MRLKVGSHVRSADGENGQVIAVADGQATVRLIYCRTLTVFYPVTDLVVLDGRAELEPVPATRAGSLSAGGKHQCVP
jgi:hypothetical protein